MKLEWMGEHRDLIEKVIRFGNRYAVTLRNTFPITNDISLNIAEVQVLEYLLENEERKENMAEIARRLGISASSFTKHVARLASLGLLEKYHRGQNKKDIIVLVSEKGKQVYTTYAESSYTNWMETVSEVLSDIPKQYLEQVTILFDLLSRPQETPAPANSQKLVLVKAKKDETKQ